MEQAIRDMGNYGVKLRKPEKLPDFDQPSDYEEEKNRFEPIKRRRGIFPWMPLHWPSQIS